MEQLINDRKFIKEIFCGILPENIIRQIIVKSISNDEIRKESNDKISTNIIDGDISNNWLSEIYKTATLNTISKYPNLLWDWKKISFEVDITVEFIEKYPNKPWEWRFISMNQFISMKMIEDNPNKPWKW